MIVSLLNYNYPFGEAPVASPQIVVEQILAFSNSKDLQQKKSEIIKKRELITNPSVIKLLKVHSQGLQLHSLYEYIPYTITSFLQMKLTTQTKDVWQMTKNLFLKKLTYELTILIAYLAKMKIEVDLTPHNLGINHQEKLKLYISNRCKMGHKTEVRLISFYGKCKQKIRQFIEQYFETIPNETGIPIHFKINENPPQFDLNTSIQAKTEHNYSKIHENLRKTNLSAMKNLIKKKNNIRRKMSSGDFQFGIKSPNPQQEESNYSVRQPRKHKYSYQCEQPRMNTQTFHNPNTTFEQEEQEQEPKFSQSKHVKIQLEQTQNDNFDVHGQKQRKNSYKVKITTFRQYEVDNCDPEELFRPEDAEKDDIFEYFAKRAKREQEQKERERQEQEQRQQQTDTRYDKSKQRKTTFETHNTRASPTSQSFLLPPNCRGHFPSSQKQSAKQHLEDRIKNAKQRAQKVISQIKRYKISL